MITWVLAILLAGVPIQYILIADKPTCEELGKGMKEAIDETLHPKNLTFTCTEALDLRVRVTP